MCKREEGEKVSCAECTGTYCLSCLSLTRVPPESWYCSVCKPRRTEKAQGRGNTKKTLPLSEAVAGVTAPSNTRDDGGSVSARSKAPSSKSRSNSSRSLGSEHRRNAAAAIMARTMDTLIKQQRELVLLFEDGSDRSSVISRARTPIVAENDQNRETEEQVRVDRTQAWAMSQNEDAPIARTYTERNPAVRRSGFHTIPALAPQHNDSFVQNISSAAANLDDMAQLRNSAGKLVFIDLPDFTGKYEEWPRFIAAYTRSTEIYKLSNVQNLARLDKSLKGDARKKVESSLLFPSAVSDIIQTLRRSFGKTTQIIKKVREEVANFPALDDSLSGIDDLCAKVRNLLAIIVASEGPEFLADQEMIEMIEEKLPSFLALQWAERKAQSRPNLETISDWLIEKTDMMNSISRQSELKSMRIDKNESRNRCCK